MSEAQAIIVKVDGAVEHCGTFQLFESLDINEALSKAGGLLNYNRPHPATGIITVRSKRKRDGKYFRRKRVDLVRRPEDGSYKLRHEDFLIAQYDVGAGNAQAP